jgi:hypothetical protein
MKASEFLMAKALEHDDFRLTKLAHELHESDADFEYIKEAGLASGLLAAGSQLLRNNVVRNAAIGAGVGAVTGAINAQPGQGLNDALKGAALGGAVGGIGTGAMGVRSALKAPGMTVGKAIGQQFNQVAGTINKAGRAFDIGNGGKTFGSKLVAPAINQAGAGTAQGHL